jgi:hypothetical protein
MLPKRIVATLRTQGPRQTLVYALGRFSKVRRAYAVVQRTRQRLLRVDREMLRGSSIFPPLPVADAVRSVRQDAVFPGLQLPESHVQALNRLARQGKWTSWMDGREFEYEEVRNGRLADHSPVVISEMPNASNNDVVQTIVQDAQIQDIVSQCLGYTPQQAKVRLLLSFACDVTPELRRKSGQTIDYHFDVHHFNFIYVNYYLTDVDLLSGAHVMIPGSHLRKPFRWLFGSARQSDEQIIAHYGVTRELTIQGKAGTGFVQDSACYHKALSPIERDRLMLQIRYY